MSDAVSVRVTLHKLTPQPLGQTSVCCLAKCRPNHHRLKKGLADRSEQLQIPVPHSHNFRLAGRRFVDQAAMINI